jgi:hypothetical protein
MQHADTLLLIQSHDAGTAWMPHDLKGSLLAIGQVDVLNIDRDDTTLELLVDTRHVRALSAA